MKKILSLAIVSMLMAPVFLSSCSNDDVLPDDHEQVMTEWIEPFHVKDASVEEVKSYMASAMKSHRLVAENTTADNIQLAYAISNTNVGVLYSFSKLTGSLYSVIDTEFSANSDLIINRLMENYTLVSSDKASLQYLFTTSDKSMVISTVKVSETCFNINYSFVY